MRREEQSMADNINMQQTEYDEVLPKLMTLHQEELENIRSIMTQISLPI